jgi:hypothetical protein
MMKVKRRWNGVFIPIRVKKRMPWMMRRKVMRRPMTSMDGHWWLSSVFQRID